ncbi:male-enhanced antigen 1 [Pholidichthys leucotaenia]
MEVWHPVMGPERVLPRPEDELGEDERGGGDGGGATLPVGVGWSGGEEEVEMGEEEEEEEDEGGYYYQPLNQEPDGVNGGEDDGEEEQERGEGGSTTEQLQQVQQRMEVMGLHLPEAPPPDSDEEDDPEAAAAQRSRASIPMDADHVELVKRTMAAVVLPSLGVPPWAREISDDQWKDVVRDALQSRQRLNRRGNLLGP